MRKMKKVKRCQEDVWFSSGPRVMMGMGCIRQCKRAAVGKFERKCYCKQHLDIKIWRYGP